MTPPTETDARDEQQASERAGAALLCRARSSHLGDVAEAAARDPSRTTAVTGPGLDLPLLRAIQVRPRKPSRVAQFAKLGTRSSSHAYAIASFLRDGTSDLLSARRECGATNGLRTSNGTPASKAGS